MTPQSFYIPRHPGAHCLWFPADTSMIPKSVSYFRFAGTCVLNKTLLQTPEWKKAYMCVPALLADSTTYASTDHRWCHLHNLTVIIAAWRNALVQYVQNRFPSRAPPEPPMSIMFIDIPLNMKHIVRVLNKRSPIHFTVVTLSPFGLTYWWSHSRDNLWGCFRDPNAAKEPERWGVPAPSAKFLFNGGFNSSIAGRCVAWHSGPASSYRLGNACTLARAFFPSEDSACLICAYTSTTTASRQIFRVIRFWIGEDRFFLRQPREGNAKPRWTA